MYEVVVEISFLATHQLRLGDEGAEPLHEHNWRVRVELEGNELGADGMLVDFVKVKKLLGEIADKLKGRDLSKLPGLISKNPSAENVARYFYEQLGGRFGGDARLAGVRVEEAKGCWGGYRA